MSDVASRTTERLHLRPIRPDDLSDLTALFALPETVAHRPQPAVDPPDVSRARLDRALDHWREHRFGTWAIAADGRTIGFGGLTRRTGYEGLNISYHLFPHSWRRGYATAFVNEAVAVAFGPLEATRVVGLVRPANPASRRVLERAGFVAEGEVDYGGAPITLLARYRPAPSPSPFAAGAEAAPG